MHCTMSCVKAEEFPPSLWCLLVSLRNPSFMRVAACASAECGHLRFCRFKPARIECKSGGAKQLLLHICAPSSAGSGKRTMTKTRIAPTPALRPPV